MDDQRATNGQVMLAGAIPGRGRGDIGIVGRPEPHLDHVNSVVIVAVSQEFGGSSGNLVPALRARWRLAEDDFRRPRR